MARAKPKPEETTQEDAPEERKPVSYAPHQRKEVERLLRSREAGDHDLEDNAILHRVGLEPGRMEDYLAAWTGPRPTPTGSKDPRIAGKQRQTDEGQEVLD